MCYSEQYAVSNKTLMTYLVQVIPPINVGGTVQENREMFFCDSEQCAFTQAV